MTKYLVIYNDWHCRIFWVVEEDTNEQFVRNQTPRCPKEHLCASASPFNKLEADEYIELLKNTYGFKPARSL